LYFMPRSAKYMARSRRSMAIILLRLPVAPSRDGPSQVCVMNPLNYPRH
jgi:hypothetical protein